MKKLLGIVVLGLLLTNNVNSKELKIGEMVTDPDTIKQLDKLRKDKHKETFYQKYADQYIKCTKISFFSKDDVVYFGFPIKSMHNEVHASWDVYEDDFKKWHIMDEFNRKYYIFHKHPGMHNDNLNAQIFYKIDRETGEMFELNKKINSEKKIRTCEKLSYDDLPMIDTKTKF
tara:strand:- start:135 stop:653 length:519 start_codon:yes stop_codon:yes gene_type:complete